MSWIKRAGDWNETATDTTVGGGSERRPTVDQWSTKVKMAKQNTNEVASTSAKLTRADLSDVETPDAVRLVASTAVAARDSGHPVIVQAARLKGRPGTMIWIPDYVPNENGLLVQVATGGNPEPATSGNADPP